MLKKRIIPILLWDGLQAVKPISFQRPYRKLGSMEQYVQVMERRGIDELIIIDIEATPHKRKPNFVKLRQFCDNLYCPVTYGGGINSLEDISMALNNGADKVAIKTRIDLLPRAARKFGKQALIYALDTYHNETIEETMCRAVQAEHQGAGEILLTDTLLDGTMTRYNLDLIEAVSEALDIPVISNGGCGEPVHMLQAFEAGASAAAAGSMFLFTEHTPKSCAKQLTEWGADVRI